MPTPMLMITATWRTSTWPLPVASRCWSAGRSRRSSWCPRRSRCRSSTPAAPVGLVVQMRATCVPVVGQGWAWTPPAVPLPMAVLPPLSPTPVPVVSMSASWFGLVRGGVGLGSGAGVSAWSAGGESASVPSSAGAGAGSVSGAGSTTASGGGNQGIRGSRLRDRAPGASADGSSAWAVPVSSRTPAAKAADPTAAFSHAADVLARIFRFALPAVGWDPREVRAHRVSSLWWDAFLSADLSPVARFPPVTR